jgi:transcriptional regulator with XRE-family HTH domain
LGLALTLVYFKHIVQIVTDVKPQPSFGDIFRQARLKAGKSLEAVADVLGYTAPYVSDVELNRRGPLTSTKIIEAAQFFKADPGPLLQSAAQQRGMYSLDVKGFSDAEFDFLNELARLPGLNREETYKKLGRVLRDQKKGRKRS